MARKRSVLPLAAACLLAASAARASFTDVTPTTGLLSSLPTWGAQAVDVDGDGDIDLNAHFHFYASSLYLNDGTAHFTRLPFLVNIQDRHALTWVDLDGDAIVDLVVSHGGDGGCGCSDDGNELYRGLGGGAFELVPGAGGMADSVGRGRSFCAADIDLDGDLDLYHAKATLQAAPNSLYRNDGSLGFSDIAPAMGVDETLGTPAGLFADYDDDGDPDLLVGGDEFDRPTTLWRNDDSTFTDATAAAFGTLPVVAGADWGDFDGDEDLDLVICEGHEGVWDAWGMDGQDYWLFSHFRYDDDGVDAYSFDYGAVDPVADFRFLGKLANNLIFLGPSGVHPPSGAFSVTLTDSLVGAPTFTPGVDTGLWCWREQPGGKFQVCVSAPPGTYGNFSALVHSPSPVRAASDSNLEQLTLMPAGPRVYRNDGGVFTEVTGSLGFTPSVNPRSVTWVDFDNDGDLDIHQTNRGTSETGGEAGILWRNDGTSFTPLTGPGWLDGETDYLSDGAVWADWDADGDQDCYVAEGAGPIFFSVGAPSRLYRNDGPAGNWLRVRLTESPGGMPAVGAKVTAWVQGQAVHRRVRADSWEGFQRPLALHFGLGAAASFDSLVVVWPGGERQVFPAGQDPTGSVLAEIGTASGPAGFAGLIYPQPALGLQRLAVDVPLPGRLRVTVHDVSGRRVRVVSDGRAALPGERTLTWDGRDEAGRRVPPGVYFLRGRGDLEFARKAVRLR
jgi:hypothetical protein